MPGSLIWKRQPGPGAGRAFAVQLRSVFGNESSDDGPRVKPQADVQYESMLKS